MKLYPENYVVSVIVNFTDLNGQAIVPTAVRAKLYDGDDMEVVDFGSLPLVDGATSKTIAIPAEFNVLGEGQLSAARILRVELETASGVVRRSTSYIIEGEFRLALMNNSFQSIEAAELLARDMPNLTGWNAASDERRFAALIESFNRLTRIPMKFTTQEPGVDLYTPLEREANRTIIGRDDWAGISETEFLTWPAHFRKTLRRAQLYEANELLEGDTMGKKARAGILSETIGESSVRLSGSKLDIGIGSQTLTALSGHIHFEFRIARA